MSQLKKSSELDRITQEIVRAVLNLLPNKVYKIVLYGSYARGDFTSESDIDLMILLNCNREEVRSYRTQVSRLSSRIGLKYDMEVSLLLRDRETFEKEQDILPFYRNVSGEGVALYG